MNRMEKLVRRRYYWPGMREDIRETIRRCRECNTARRKLENYKKGKFQPIISERPFEMVCMDIVGPLPITSSENRYILTIIDRFTRFVMAIPLPNIDAITVARAFVNQWIYMFGAPEKVLSDNGTQFKSEVLGVVNAIMGIKQLLTSIYHPEANGLIERFHNFLKEKLKIAALQFNLDYFGIDDWDRFVPSIVHAYNITPHTITKYAPYELLFGRSPQLPIRMAPFRLLYEDKPLLPVRMASARETKRPNINNYKEYLQELVKQTAIMHGRTKKWVKMVNTRLENRKNQDSTPFSFLPHDEVYYYIGNKLKGNEKKLNSNWKGPYEIIEIQKNTTNFVIREIIPPIQNPEKMSKEQIQQYKQRKPEQLVIHGKYLVLSEEFKRAQQQQRKLPEPEPQQNDQQGGSK